MLTNELLYNNLKSFTLIYYPFTMLKNLNSAKNIIIALAIVLCIVITIFIRSFIRREVNANITPADVFVGDALFFSDSTRNAKQWLWEFGDSGSSELCTGKYFAHKSGILSVRLTVDNKLTRYFKINVRERVSKNISSVISIDAPEQAIQGEYITFKGIGTATQWRWEFGESNKIDSREKVAIYAYNTPGVYEILLNTETTEYPIRHTIKIIPNAISDTTDLQIIMGNDIKIRLQAIVDGQSFNNNYNYILERYLSNNPDIPVVVNNIKDGNSFWSYCQGLKIIGRGKTSIKSVIVDVVNIDQLKVEKLIVMQETLK
jgi:hypothetical protein